MPQDKFCFGASHLSPAGEFLDAAGGRSESNEIAEGIGGVVAAGSLFVDVGFEDIAGAVRVVLQVRQTFDQVLAAFVKGS